MTLKNRISNLLMKSELELIQRKSDLKELGILKKRKHEDKSKQNKT